MKKIFISYFDKDKKKRKCIENMIKNRKDDGLFAIVVPSRITPSADLRIKVAKGINECTYFVPIITLASFNCPWVNQEIGFAFAAKKKIIPIVDDKLLKDLQGFINSNTEVCLFKSDSDIYKEFGNFTQAALSCIEYIQRD